MAKKKTAATTTVTKTPRPRAVKTTTGRNPPRSGPIFYRCDPCGVATLVDECPAHGPLERLDIESVRFALHPVPAEAAPLSDAEAATLAAVTAEQDRLQTGHRERI